jgi:hypothetical protein
MAHDHTACLLELAGMNGVAKLYRLAIEHNLTELESIMLEPTFVPTCDHVRKIMSEYGGIQSCHEDSENLWPGADPGMMLSFLGNKTVENRSVPVSTPEYIQIFYSVLPYMEKTHMEKMDAFCLTFVKEFETHCRE